MVSPKKGFILMLLNKRTNSKRMIAVASALAVSLGTFVVPASAQNAYIESNRAVITNKVDYHMDTDTPIGNHRFLVHLKENQFESISSTDRAQTFSRAGAAVDEALKVEEPGLGFDNVVLVTTNRDLTESEAKKFMEALAADIRVEHVEADQWIAPMAAPNDELYPKQWALHDVEYEPIDGTWSSDFDRAWELGFDGSDQTIAIVDTGQVKHPDLDSKTVQGWDMISDPSLKFGADGDGRDNDPTDEGMYRTGSEGCGVEIDSTWHGTHVAGIAGAATNNSEGMSGAAPGANLLPVRVMGKCGGTLADFAAAIVWASGGEVQGAETNRNPAGIINMSLGTQSRCNATFSDAIATARANGAILVAAAGNKDDGADWTAPGNCDGLITVASTGPSGKRASYSNYGPEVEIAAPGGDNWAVDWENEDGWSINPIDEWEIFSTVDKGLEESEGPGYGPLQGTSQATPLVSGAIALARQAKPDVTHEEVLAALQKTALPFSEQDPQKPIGAGILNVPDFLQELAPESVPTTTENTTPVSPTSEEATTTATSQTSTVTAEPSTTTVNTTTSVTETSTATVTSTIDSTVTTTEPGAPVTVTDTTIVNPEPVTITETTHVTEAGTTTEETETVTTTVPGDTVIKAPETVTTVVTTHQNGETKTEESTFIEDVTVTPAPTTVVEQEPTPRPSTVVETTKEPTLTLTPVITVDERPTTTTSTVTETAPVDSNTDVSTTTNVETHTATSTQTETTIVDSNGDEVPVVTETLTLAPVPSDGDNGKIEFRWGGMRDGSSDSSSVGSSDGSSTSFWQKVLFPVLGFSLVAALLNYFFKQKSVAKMSSVFPIMFGEKKRHRK